MRALPISDYIDTSISLYDPALWRDLWRIRALQLLEAGVRVDIPDAPEAHPRYDDDLHAVDRVYAHPGGFWLAYAESSMAGFVGAQCLGAVVELRRMFVSAEFRRRGVGRALCAALIEHCAAQAAKSVELWTAADGPGRSLYAVLGFAVVAQPGLGFENVREQTGYAPKRGEIRMRLTL